MSLPKSTTKKKLKEQHGRCYYCGCFLEYVKIETDHIIPKSKGGSSCVSNFCLACKWCNRLKSDMLVREFYKLISEQYPNKLIRGYFYFEFLGLGRNDG